MKTHQIVDFGPGPEDNTQGYPFEGTDDECLEWLDEHQETDQFGRSRYSIQEIPWDEGFLGHWI